MAIAPSELERMLREKMEEPDATIHDMTDNGGFGLVRWSRPVTFAGGHTEDGTGLRPGREHIVHRWATKDTAGSIQWPDGYFYSGGYYNEEKQARADYRIRIDKAYATKEA